MNKDITLSAALQELENTVKQLEQESEIEAATVLYEKAMKLSVLCTQKISLAKQKITELSENGDDNG